MTNVTFREQEALCEQIFLQKGPFWHICTPENHPILFGNESDYKMAVNLLGVSAKLFPDIHILACQIMSNHLHEIVSGSLERVLCQVSVFKKYLSRSKAIQQRATSLDHFVAKHFGIDSLSYLRNSIVYVNRNGYVVNPNTTPFSYPWGSSRFYFNPEAILRHQEIGKPLTLRERQQITHSRTADMITDLYTVDGYVSPLSFCDIVLGESLFRGARHYSVQLAKSVESHRDLAHIIGETMYYTDDDLFSITMTLIRTQYGNKAATLLSNSEKVELAKTLHRDYNASNRQITRFLKLDPLVVDGMFPADRRDYKL